MTTQVIHILEAAAQRHAYRDEHAERVRRRRWRAKRSDLMAILHRQTHKVLGLLDSPYTAETIHEIEQLTMMIVQITALDKAMH